MTVSTRKKRHFRGFRCFLGWAGLSTTGSGWGLALRGGSGTETVPSLAAETAALLWSVRDCSGGTVCRGPFHPSIVHALAIWWTFDRPWRGLVGQLQRSDRFYLKSKVGTGNSGKILIGSELGMRRQGNFAPAGGRRGAHGVTRPTTLGMPGVQQSPAKSGLVCTAYSLRQRSGLLTG